MKYFRLLFIFHALLTADYVSAQFQTGLTLEDIEQSESSLVEGFDDMEALEEKIIENNVTRIDPKISFRKTHKYIPPVYRALLKRGSLVESVVTGKVYRTDREFFVKAQQHVFGDSQSYILNSRGKWAYRTKAMNLASVEKDVDLGYPNIRSNEKYEKSFYHNIEDPALQLDHRLTFILQSMQADLYKDLLNNGEINSATATRIEWRTFYRWHIPLQFGLSLNYQDGNYDSNTAKWQAVNFGPVLRYPILQKDNLTFKLSTGVQKSAYYRAKVSGGDFYLTALTWHVDLEATIASPWGNWILGLEYRSQYSGVSKDIDNLIVDNTDRERNKSLGFVFGREFNLDIF